MDPSSKTVTFRDMPEVFGIVVFGDEADIRLTVYLREKGVNPMWWRTPVMGRFEGYFHEADREVVFDWLKAEGAVYQKA